MKKLIVTTAIILGLSMTTFAQGGLFHRGASAESEVTEYSLSKNATREGGSDPIPMLPSHNSTNDSQTAPVGSGIAVLMSLGAAYMVAKKREE